MGVRIKEYDLKFYMKFFGPKHGRNPAVRIADSPLQNLKNLKFKNLQICADAEGKSCAGENEAARYEGVASIVFWIWVKSSIPKRD